MCPFHDEKTPSFTVSEDKQICHCFGCKKGGNVFQFTQEIKGLSFTEAVKELGERVNIKVDTGSTTYEAADPPFLQPKQWHICLSSETVKEGVFSSWKGHKPM